MDETALSKKPPPLEMENQTSAEVQCIGCGYDLTGVAIGNACPECGVSVSQTIDHGHTMTRRQAVTIVLRLTALSIGLYCLTLTDMIVWIIMALTGLSTQVTWDEYVVIIAVTQGVPLMIRFGLAIAIWLTAPRLSAWLVRHDGAVLQHGRTHPRDILSLGLILLGVYAVIYGGGILIGLFVTGQFDFTPDNAFYAYANLEISGWTAAAWTVAGLLLIGSARLRAWLGRDLSRRR